MIAKVPYTMAREHGAMSNDRIILLLVHRKVEISSKCVEAVLSSHCVHYLISTAGVT